MGRVYKVTGVAHLFNFWATFAKRLGDFYSKHLAALPREENNIRAERKVENLQTFTNLLSVTSGNL